MTSTPATTAPFSPGDLTQRQAAKVAGIGYLTIFVLAIFANFFVRTNLLDTDDAAATFDNISQHETVFRLGLLAFVVIFLVDIAIAWALHVLFRPTGAQRSLLAAWFRLTYTVFLGVAAIFMFLTLRLISDEAYLSAFSLDELHAQTMLAMEAFNYTWLIGLAAFGVHLALVGGLVVRSGTGPRLLGYVLVVAGIAYLIDTTAYAVLTDYADVANILLVVVAVPSVIGEFWFMWWLLTTAGRTPRNTDATSGEPSVSTR